MFQRHFIKVFNSSFYYFFSMLIFKF